MNTLSHAQLKSIMDRAEAFAAEHVRELSAECLQMQANTVQTGPRLAQLRGILNEMRTTTNVLSIAETLVSQAAMRAAAQWMLVEGPDLNAAYAAVDAGRVVEKEDFEAGWNAAKANGACENDSYGALWNAVQRIDTAAVFLPGFTVQHEGGIEAVAQNIVDAICRVTEQHA